MSEQDCQTANSKTTTVSMQFGPLVVHYVGVYDLQSGPCTQTCKYFFTSAHGQVSGKLKPWGNTKILNIPACETGFYECTAPYEIHAPTRRVINTKKRKQTKTC